MTISATPCVPLSPPRCPATSPTSEQRAGRQSVTACASSLRTTSTRSSTSCSGSGSSSCSQCLCLPSPTDLSQFCLRTSDSTSFTLRLVSLINPVTYLTMIVKIRHQYDADLKTHLQSILDQSQLGDWFVLYQLRYKTSHLI